MVKWLLIGAGDIANNRVAPALRDANNSELIAVCDVVEAKARALAERMGVKTIYTDYAQALAESGADAVYIATPCRFHVKMCLQALEAGKHFLSEKPLGLNGAECLKLLEAARKSDRITSCSNYRRHSEQYKATVAMIKNKEIGKLQGGWMIYATPFYNPGKGATLNTVYGSPIKELGFYIIDIAHNIFGMPCGVMAQKSTFNPSPTYDLDDLSSIIFRFPGGELFTIVIHFSPVQTRHELEIFGSEGRIYWPAWPPHGNGPVMKIKNEITEVKTYTTPNFHLPMIADFVDAVLNNHEPLCTIESAVKTELITDAIFRSAQSGKIEPVIWKKEH